MNDQEFLACVRRIAKHLQLNVLSNPDDSPCFVKLRDGQEPQLSVRLLCNGRFQVSTLCPGPERAFRGWDRRITVNPYRPPEQIAREVQRNVLDPYRRAKVSHARDVSDQLHEIAGVPHVLA